jgi:hypothetical protein
MAKTLSESAAEILKASMNAGKEPLAAPLDNVNDLGGATNDNPGGTVNEPPTVEAPKPGQSNTESPEKKIGSVKSQGLAKPAAMDATLNPSLGEEVEQIDENHEDTYMKHMGAHLDAAEAGDWDKAEMHAQKAETAAAKHFKKTGKRIKDIGYTGNSKYIVSEEVSDLSEEDLAEAKKDWMKKKIADHKGSMKEDVDALFNGESLSEDFRVKATLIFESAVTSRVESILEGVLADNDELLSEAVSEIKTQMSEQVDAYLNYVVEEWMKENAIAIESGLRAELTEDFINGLKNLFVEHYVEIPDEKLDVAEELAARVVELEEAAEAAAAETAALSEELNAVKKDEAIRKVCEGLTEVQIGKMKSLAESVEFTTEGDFDHKLAVIRENYFPSKVQVKSEVKAIQEAAADEAPEEVVQASGIMAHYVKSLTKTAPKA